MNEREKRTGENLDDIDPERLAALASLAEDGLRPNLTSMPATRSWRSSIAWIAIALAGGVLLAGLWGYYLFEARQLTRFSLSLFAVVVPPTWVVSVITGIVAFFVDPPRRWLSVSAIAISIADVAALGLLTLS